MVFNAVVIFTGFIFVITLFLLILRLKSTDDEVMRRRYMKNYAPVIILCIIVFTLYIAVFIWKVVL